MVVDILDAGPNGEEQSVQEQREFDFAELTPEAQVDLLKLVNRTTEHRLGRYQREIFFSRYDQQIGILEE